MRPTFMAAVASAAASFAAAAAAAAAAVLALPEKVAVYGWEEKAGKMRADQRYVRGWTWSEEIEDIRWGLGHLIVM